MIHCKNYKIKCDDNPYPWCDVFQCPHYESNIIWKEEDCPDVDNEEG